MDPRAANRVLAHALSTGPQCGAVTVIGIDGPAGSGKSTLAAAIAGLTSLPRVAIISTDDLCPGWQGLGEIPRRLHALVTDLAATGHATYPTWDWQADRPGTDGYVGDTDLVVIEGVCSLDPACARYRSASVWIETPLEVRRDRALRRDGEIFAPHWDAWAQAENTYYAGVTITPDLVITNR